MRKISNKKCFIIQFAYKKQITFFHMFFNTEREAHEFAQNKLQFWVKKWRYRVIAMKAVDNTDWSKTLKSDFLTSFTGFYTDGDDDPDEIDPQPCK